MEAVNITEKQFFDYISCPAKYDFIYNKKIIINEKFRLSNILIRISNFFYIYLLDNKKPPTLNTLFNKYESIYKKYEDIISSKEYSEGLFYIRNFYNWACNNKIAVISTDSSYELVYKNIRLTGILNPIAINNGKKLEFLIMNYSKRGTDQLEADMKLKYTIDILAFNNSYRRDISAIKIHDVKSSKDIITVRNNTDYERLYSTLEGVSKGITSNVYFPHETHMCTSCQYRHLCKGWKH